jgi:hypothetical protein
MRALPAYPFVPTPDVAAVLHILLDVYERRGGDAWRDAEDKRRQAVRVHLADIDATLPDYYSQTDPLPRTTANEQLLRLEKRGLVNLAWQPGQAQHLLATVTLEPQRVAELYELLAREPLSDRRLRLQALLLGDRFRLEGWRRRAVQHCLDRLKAHKSPAPFNLEDDAWNQDLMAALVALPQDVTEETPYRVFSVHVFNDSKRFDALKSAVARMARRHQTGWGTLSNREVLRELGLVANPSHLYLSGPWQLVDAQGQVTSLSEFYPSVGIPSALAARVRRARVDASRVLCVENLTPFYELVRHEGARTAALCLWGNPSPSGRHLLRCLVNELPPMVPLLLWADVDGGGLSILAQLREKVSPRFEPYRMDVETLASHAHWAQPLSSRDERYLTRLKDHPLLTDVRPVIDYMLSHSIKLEQEAVSLCTNS